MYYPILRGKRFELLALRDLASMLGASKKVFPLIEPVRKETVDSDLGRAMMALAEKGVAFGVVINPTVGEFKGAAGPPELLAKLASLEYLGDQLVPWIHFVTIASPSSHHVIANELVRDNSVFSGIPSVIWCPESLDVAQLGLDLAGLRVVAMLAPARRMITRLSREMEPRPLQVLFSDPFPWQRSNSEYVNRTESIFTEEHLYLEDERLDGFADFATIGGTFTEGGGAPKVVVIHWTYTKPVEVGDVGSPVYLSHFWSDPEDDLRDVASKYAKASAKLLAFAEAEHLPSNPAFEVLRNYHARGDFPGLGMLKKLSIVNHIHVVSTAL